MQPVRRKAKGLAVTACAAMACALAQPSGAARILVLQSASTPRLMQTLAVLRERVGVPVDVIQLADTRDEPLERAIASGAGDTVIVTLGPHASDYVFNLKTPAPVVHCLAGADAMRAGLPSVPSDVPGDLQASWLRKLLPSARSIGLLYNPVRNTRRAEAMAASLSMAGYRVMLQVVGTPAELPAALDQVSGRIDALLALRDATVYTRETSRGILLFLFRRNIPLIGPDDAWVNSGALYALDWDYADVGAACAVHAVRALKSGKPALDAPPLPRTRVTVNRRSAAGFDLDWPQDVLRDADIRQ